MDIDATVSQLDTDVSTDAMTIAFIAVSIADSNISTSSTAEALIEAGARVTGRGGVDIGAFHTNVGPNRSTEVLSIGIPVPIERGGNDTKLTTRVTAEDGATVSAVAHDDASPLGNRDGFDRLALLVETTHTGVTDSSEDRDIAWDADVVISSGPSPELWVNADGQIVRAVNVSVDDSATAGQSATKTSGQIESSQVVVNDIYNDDPGEVVFDATGGAISGSGGVFTFRSTYDSVKITNESSKTLVINDIDVADRGANCAAAWTSPPRPPTAARSPWNSTSRARWAPPSSISAT